MFRLSAVGLAFAVVLVILATVSQDNITVATPELRGEVRALVSAIKP